MNDPPDMMTTIRPSRMTPAPAPAPSDVPLRVLHVYSGNLYGGVERVLVTLARHRQMNPSMLQQFTLCFDGRLARELRDAGAEMSMLGGVRRSRPWTIWAARRRLRRVVRDGRSDVAVFHGPWAMALLGRAAHTAGAATVLWVHGRCEPSHWTWRRARRAPCSGVIAVSRDTAASLGPWTGATPAGGSAENVEVIYAPFSSGEAVRPAETRERIRRQLSTPANHVVVLQVSRIEEGKGHAVHLQALAAMNDVPGWTCWFAGGGQRPVEQRLLRSLQDLSRELGLVDRVRWLGERDDIPDLLSAADVFCQPNVMPEGFGIAFAEALSAGLPVVTSAFGGATELVDASCGRLLPPGDVSAVTAALRELVTDPSARARLSVSAPLRVRSTCDPARQMAALSRYLELCRQRRC